MASGGVSTDAPAVRAGVRIVAAHPLPFVVAILLALTLGFFNQVFAGAHFSTVPAHRSAVYPWAGLPSSGQQFYPQSDQSDLSYPWHTFLTRSLDEGTLPFWDPHSYGGGYPLFANGSSAPLYPPRLLGAMLFDPARAHDIYLMLHVFLAGLCMYGLLREFGAGRAGSLLSAVSWMFAGFNMAWMHLEVVTPMSVFIPLTLLCVHRAFHRPTWGSAVLAGLAMGGALLSGHLLLLGIVYMVAAAYGGALAAAAFLRAARSGQWRSGLAPVGRLLCIVGVSLGSGMVVLLPTAFALTGSQRDAFSYAELTQSFLAPARTLLYGLVPPPLPVTAERMHEMAFAGTATALLAVIGLLARRPGAWLGRVLLFLAFAIAIRTPATWLAYNLLPGFSVFRPYSRLLVFAAFALALLGGIGLDTLWRRIVQPGEGLIAVRRHERPRRLKGVLDHRTATVVSVVVIAVSAVQLGRYGRDVNPPAVPGSIDANLSRTPLVRALETSINAPGRWPGRIVPTSVFPPGGAPGPPVLYAASALVFGIDTAGGYDSVVPRRTTALMRVLQGEDPDTVLATGLPSAYAPTFDSPSTRFDLLPRLGITAMVTNPGARLEETPTPAGPAPSNEVIYDGPDGRVLAIAGASAAPYLVFGDEVVRSPAAAFRRFLDPGFDFRRRVVIESADLRDAGIGDLRGTDGTGQVLSAERGVNTARITVTSSAPAWLVFHDSFDPGWSATVDGEPAEVVRVNYAKRAVLVPAGRSDVRMRYRPPGLVAGGVVSALTLLACAAPPACRRVPRRRMAPTA